MCAVIAVLWGRGADRSTIAGSGVSWRPAAAVTSSRSKFSITGSVGALYPGDATHLSLTLTNPQHFAIVVTSITTAVGTPSSGCSGSELTVAGFSGRLNVPAGGRASVPVPVALSHAAPDACQGAAFPLTYTGLAQAA